MKLLIVDDNFYDRKGLAELPEWEELNFSEIHLANNGEEGLAKALQIEPLLVLTDISMPHIDGLSMAKKILEEKIIVIVRGVEKEKLLLLCEAMYEGGIRLLEVTFDASGKVSDSETAENIKMLSEAFKGRMYIGAGTVLTKEQVELVKDAGGSFIISPNTDREVIEKTISLGMVS